MEGQEKAPLRALSRNLLVAAVVVLIGIGAAAAFAVGFSGAIEERLADPASAPQMRIAALEKLRDALGYDGFLKVYRAIPPSGVAQPEGTPQLRPAARTDDLLPYLREAGDAMARLHAAGENNRDAADEAAIGALAVKFDRAATAAATGASRPATSELEQTYATLKLRIADALDAARFRRIETLSRSFATAQALAVAALTALALTLFATAWFLRARLLEPLRALRESAEQSADGGIYRTIWGAERRDEIGSIARAVNRMRRKLVEASDGPKDEMRAILDNQPLRRTGDTETFGAARRTEAGLDGVMAAVNETKVRIEEAARDAARASQTAIEAADLARTGAQRLMMKAEHTISAAGKDAQVLMESLTASIARLSSAAQRLEAVAPPIGAPREQPRATSGRARSFLGRLGANDTQEADEAKAEADVYAAIARLADTNANTNDERDPSAPLAGLAADLDTLEALARKGEITQGDAAAMTAALIEAIDRLNGVVERVAAAASEKKPTLGAWR